MIYLKLVLATIIWGLTPTINKLLSEYSSPFVITFFRFFFAGLAFSFLFVYLRKNFYFTKSSLVLFCCLGFFGFVMHNALMCKGLEGTSAGLTSIIMSLIVVQVVLIEWLLTKKTPSKLVSLGILMTIFGVYFVSGNDGLKGPEDFFFSEFLVFLSALSWAIYTVICRTALKHHDELTVLTFATLFAILFLLPLPALHYDVVTNIIMDHFSVGLLAFTGLISSALTFFWHQQAIQKIGVLTTSIFLNLVPIFGVISATLILKEEFNIRMIIGTIITVAGVVIVNVFQKPKSNN